MRRVLLCKNIEYSRKIQIKGSVKTPHQKSQKRHVNGKNAYYIVWRTHMAIR